MPQIPDTKSKQEEESKKEEPKKEGEEAESDDPLVIGTAVKMSHLREYTKMTSFSEEYSVNLLNDLTSDLTYVFFFFFI